MKLSPREIVLGILTIAAILFGVTYWLASSKIDEFSKISSDASRLSRQAKLNRKILDKQEVWTGIRDRLRAILPEYNSDDPITVILPKEIKRMADKQGLSLSLTQPEGETSIGSINELRVRCDWQGTLEQIIFFLHELHKQGIRFDVSQISMRPIANRPGQLRGSMVINSAYKLNDKN